MRAFGVGSLWFGLRASSFEGALSSSGSAHLEIIKQRLESISNIDNITIENCENLSVTFNDISVDKKCYWPLYPNVEIRFDLYLPLRIQNQLFQFGELRTGAERFNIIIKYGYECPVFYISYDAPEEYHRPSDCVVVARKYLESQFLDSKDIVFESLGPSPFHSQFWLQKSDQEIESKFISKNMTLKNDGYQSIIFEYDKSIDDESVAWEFFVDDSAGDIECFYVAVINRNKMMRLVAAAEDSLDELIDIHSATGFRGKLKQYLHSDRSSRDLMVSLLEIERCKRHSAKKIDDYERNGNLGDYPVFSDKVRVELKEFDDVLPIQQIGDVVKIFEERHLKSRENLTVLLVGVFGGVVGSLITFFLKA